MLAVQDKDFFDRWHLPCSICLFIILHVLWMLHHCSLIDKMWKTHCGQKHIIVCSSRLLLTPYKRKKAWKTPGLKYLSFTYYLSYMPILYGFTQTHKNDQLPVGFIAELVDHHTVAQKAWVRILFKPGFFQVFFRCCLRSIINSCDDQSIIRIVVVS